RQDVFAARLRHPVDERGGGHDEARRAEAALCGVVLVERGLHGREVVCRAQAFERFDRGTVDGRERQEARPSRLAVDQDRAGTAPALVAAGLGTRDVELLTQGGEERRERRAMEIALLAVYRKSHFPPPRSSSAR